MDTTNRQRKRGVAIAIRVLVLAVVLSIAAVHGGRWALDGIRHAHAAAQYSAQAALLTEIEQQLSAVPRGGSYPGSLEELPLAYPDGGDESLLENFTYNSDGMRCTLRTRLGDHWIVESYPRTSNP